MRMGRWAEWKASRQVDRVRKGAEVGLFRRQKGPVE